MEKKTGSRKAAKGFFLVQGIAVVRIGIAEGGIFRVPSADTEADIFSLPKITFVAG